MKPLRRVILAFLVFFALPALSCNLPVGPDARARTTATPREPLPQIFPTRNPDESLNPFGSSQQGQPIPTNPAPEAGKPYAYYAQSGDTLPALSARFNVDPDQITSPQLIPPQGFIPPGQPLDFPANLPPATYPGTLLPDTEIVNGVTAVDFNVAEYVREAGGFLSEYSEDGESGKMTGAEIVQRIAVESSTNPKLLLAVLQYTSGWVQGKPKRIDRVYPIGFYVPQYKGLFKELSLVARQISLGYYGWRDGTLTGLQFIDATKTRISPNLNAGSVAVQYLFAKLLDRKPWEQALYGEDSFSKTYAGLFGDPWARAEQIGPIFPAGLEQPALELPFAPKERWSFTGGPHISWGVGSPLGAIDFAPVTGETRCAISAAWALAAAPGIVVRSEKNQVALDLDGDGKEQTGWVVFYYHLSEQERVPAKTEVKTGDRLGHPSCEGGRTTGTHFHVARKYNGEWLPAGEPLPFVLSGWTVHPGKAAYEGTLVKGAEVVTARPDGEHDSIIVKEGGGMGQ